MYGLDLTEAEKTLLNTRTAKRVRKQGPAPPQLQPQPQLPEPGAGAGPPPAYDALAVYEAAGPSQQPDMGVPEFNPAQYVPYVPDPNSLNDFSPLDNPGFDGYDADNWCGPLQLIWDWQGLDLPQDLNQQGFQQP